MRTFFTGQISILATLITSAGVIVASAFGAWTTASQQVSAISARVDVVTEREQNHYDEVQKQLDTIDKKLDLLLSGGKSSLVIQK